jgi:hypothetical protein
MKGMKSQTMDDISVVKDALRRWDPIGVFPGPGDDEGPIDEYDSYAPHLLSVLMKGCDAKKLEQELAVSRSKRNTE